MSELKVNKISPRDGTAFTLGDSGDTFTVPAGANIVNSGTATGFGGGAWTFISSAAASDSTSVEFTSGIDSTYDTYMLTINNLVSSSSSLRPYLQVSVSSSFITSGDYAYYMQGNTSGGGSVDAGSAQSTSMNIMGNTPMYSAASHNGDGIIWFHNPASTTSYCKFQWIWSAWDYSDSLINGRGSGCYDGATSAIDGVRLLATQSGNFTSGTFRLYGLAKS
jgi:hypothetical protein